MKRRRVHLADYTGPEGRYFGLRFDRHLDDETDPAAIRAEDKLIAALGSAERVDVFKQRVRAYWKQPNLLGVLVLMQDFPEVEIFVERFNFPEVEIFVERGSKLVLRRSDDSELLFRLMEKHGLDKHLLARAIVRFEKDDHESAVDAFCLQMLNLLSRNKKNVTGKVGPDALVAYLTTMILEAVGSFGTALPSSLIELLRHALSGQSPDLFKARCSIRERRDAIWAASRLFNPDERITIREGAKRLDVNETQMERWLNTGFREEVERARDRASVKE